MYNYKLVRLGYKPVFYLMFTGGICAGSIVSLLFIFMDRGSLGFFGSAFLTLLAGLSSGLISLIYIFVFNTLAPATGGIPLKIISQSDTLLPENDPDSSFSSPLP